MNAGVEPEPAPGGSDGFGGAGALPHTDEPHVILGVLPGAELETVRQAFRRLALQHHPDKGGKVADFQRLQGAADALLGAAADKCGGPSCVAPAARHGRAAAGRAQEQHRLLALPAQHSGWRLAEASNGMGYSYLIIIHSCLAGPCIALHKDSLGGFQYRRRRAGSGWYDAEAFADGGGAKVAGVMVSMVGVGRCIAVVEDGRVGTGMGGAGVVHEWGNWRLRSCAPDSDGAGAAGEGRMETGGLVIKNGKLARSAYAIVLSEAAYGQGPDSREGEAVFTDSGGRMHALG
jgi:hypothetical protein